MITTILAALAASAQPTAPTPAPSAPAGHHQGMDHGEKGCACCKDMDKDKPMACCAKSEKAKGAQHDGHSAH